MEDVAKRGVEGSAPQTSACLGIEDLPSSLREALRCLGKEARENNIDIYLFGSFAEGRAWPGSDLDLAYEGHLSLWKKRQLDKKIDDLPTIRRVDLVPLETASSTLAAEIRQNGILLFEL